MTVEVYGRDECVQCKYTVKELEKQGIPYEYKDASELKDAQAGTQLPVVIAGENRWSGLKIDKIRELSETPKGINL